MQGMSQRLWIALKPFQVPLFVWPEMGQGDRHRTTKTKPYIFRTPNKPASSSKLKRAPATLGSLAVKPAPSSASASSAPSASRSSKRSSARSARDQPTLTQIDFVTKPQNLDSDDDYKYIGEPREHAREVIEIEDDVEEDQLNDNDEDAEYRPSSTSRAKRAHGIRFDHALSKRKKPSDHDSGNKTKGRRKSGDQKGKGPQKDDKTLTQMNYVQRVDLDKDDDTKLEYAYITPKRKGPERQTTKSDEPTDVQQPPTCVPEPASQHKRRKLSPYSDAKVSYEPEDNHEKIATGSPITPRKSLRTEIPSSQSPESPSVTFITSSQFRGAALSPQKGAFQARNKPHAKEESPGLHKFKGNHKTPVQTSYPDTKPSLSDLNSPPPSLAQRKSTGNTPVKANGILEHATEAVTETPNPKQRGGATQRTVIYETDAESDYDGFQDDLLDAPSPPGDMTATTPDGKTADEEAPDSQDIESQDIESQDIESQDIESQELPPLSLSEQEVELSPPPWESNLLSDASICHQRLHQATQFPLDPVPTINTQKMAELFPDESSGLHPLTTLSQSSSPMKMRPPHPQMKSQAQDEDQGQSESQGLDRTPTEMVPESSPVARHDSASVNRHVPTARDAEVQVESSQPVDRIDRINGQRTDQNSGPRGVLSRSQILTSSVMESIPLPAFWMSSQDSVGEPYSLPDT